MARFSTDLRLDQGWKLEDVPDQALANMLHVSLPEVAKARRALAAQLEDPAWVGRTLERLPAATLAMLQLIVEAGGWVHVDELQARAKDRFGLQSQHCEVATVPAMKAGLVVPLMTGRGGAVGLIHPAITEIAARAVDLDLAPLRADALVAHPDGLDARTLLALCMAAQHCDLKLTRDGDLHRGTLKRLAKRVSLDEDQIYPLLMTAIATGLVRAAPEGELARPNLPALRDAAVGRYAEDSGVPRLQALTAAGPVPRRALEASLRRRDEHAVAAALYLDGCRGLPGLRFGTVDGIEVVAAAEIAGGASGHVTPSFEVFLPPESRLLDIVQVGACAEWERLDRAIVGKITKAAVQNALAIGVTSAQLLGWLAEASRHPIPQNVEVAIRDWAGAVVPATVLTGHVIVVEPAHAAKAASALAKLAPHAVAPGVFVVDAMVERRQVARLLDAAGIQSAAPPVAAEPPAPRRAAQAAPSAEGDARLRARVGAWRRGEPFEGVRDDFLETFTLAKTAATATASTRASASSVRGLDAMQALAPLLARVRRGQDVLSDAALEEAVGALRDLSAEELELLLDAGENEAALRQLLGQIERARPDAPRSRRAAAHRGGARSTRQARREPLRLSLLWQREAILPRLEQAAQRGEALALDIAGMPTFVKLERVMRRGTTWMVLGEDIVNGASVAHRLDAIAAIAALPDGFDQEALFEHGLDSAAGDEHLPAGAASASGAGRDRADATSASSETVRGPWRPAPGQAPPPGHVPCPCGSGNRYRNCCRHLNAT